MPTLAARACPSASALLRPQIRSRSTENGLAGSRARIAEPGVAEMPSNRDAAVKTRVMTSTLGLALQIFQVGTASLGLLFGVCTVRALIRLARMVPTRPSAEPNCGPSPNDVDPQAS